MGIFLIYGVCDFCYKRRILREIWYTQKAKRLICKECFNEMMRELESGAGREYGDEPPAYGDYDAEEVENLLNLIGE